MNCLIVKFLLLVGGWILVISSVTGITWELAGPEVSRWVPLLASGISLVATGRMIGSRDE